MSNAVFRGPVVGPDEFEAKPTNAKNLDYFKSLLRSGSTRSSVKSKSGNPSRNYGYEQAKNVKFDQEADHRIRGEKSKLGMTLEVGELYRENRESPWDEWIPDDISGLVDPHNQFQTHALIVRREKKEGESGLVLHSIIVQSPLLRKVLDDTFDSYQGISTKLRELKFYAPFREFYYRWHRFEQLCQEERDTKIKEHLALLYPIIDKEIRPHITAMEDFMCNGVVSFSYLWAIFPPGAIIYSKIEDQDRLYKLRKATYGKNMSGVPYLSISCQYVDCDGTSFGYRSASLMIDHFDGVKNIDELNVFPSQMHPDLEALLDKLNTRGEKFEKLNGFNHVSYSGFYVDRSPDINPTKRYTHESRIIVDPKVFSFHTRDPNRPMDPLFGGRHAGKAEDEYQMCPVAVLARRATERLFSNFDGLMTQYEEGDLAESSRSLTAKQRFLTTPTVRGFCLSSKRWAEFYVSNIQPIKWSEDSFKRLSLPNNNKDIILAFVEEQLTEKDSFDDIIQGKGQGFIMLLSGEPGVGKTLTAESVAEEMRKPLYCISAGELGESAAAVEKSLETVLELGATWEAIVLLDECDIFLEQRTLVDIQRNRLVSIFLRQLEYYRGVMFLTTNRVSTIDTAFESRIHLSIAYPPLDFQSRVQIWKTFTKLQGSSESYSSNLEEKDLEILAANEMNGRQIKNVVKTARLLAKQKKVPLGLEHIEMVLEVKKKGQVVGGQRIGGPGVVSGIKES